MKSWLIIAFIAAISIIWSTWFHRFTTNTAGGRFYKTDRWTGCTLVVEKDGYIHELSENNRAPYKGAKSSNEAVRRL